MADRRMRLLPILLLAPATIAQQGAPADAPPAALVRHALAAELRAAQDSAHPMRYRLFKSTPRVSSVKEICETRDGSVARLLEMNGQPLGGLDEQKEQARLDSLLSDPSRQRHRKQSEDQDASRALAVLRALPNAFLYTYAGSEPGGHIEKFTFKPNPDFDPPNLETQVLTQMTGEIWLDAAQGRVTRLEGHLQQDVDFGWGILGRLNKGGWIVIEQADVGQGQWHIVRFQMSMNGRVLFKNRSFDTTEEESRFEPVPPGISYADGIRLLRAEPPTAEHSGR